MVEDYFWRSYKRPPPTPPKLGGEEKSPRPLREREELTANTKPDNADIVDIMVVSCQAELKN